MWMMPLHLHVNQKSDYDYDYDDECRHNIFQPNAITCFFPRIRENMLFDGKVKMLRINGLVSKSFPGKKHVRIQRGVGGGQMI